MKRIESTNDCGSAPPAIVVENVSKTYPRRALLSFLRGSESARGGTQALSGINFTIREGETVGLLGPNGAGKTTLLKIISSLLYPTSGRVLVHGYDLVTQSLRARSIMGLVTCDDRSFYWRLTGRQNLEFFSTLYGIPKRKIADRVAELFDTLGLSHAADRPFHSYSSGMKQKLAIARGLLGDPRIVLYDEPTRSLDPLSAQNIHHWILEHRPKSRQTAHLIATNQLREAELLCDRVLIINRGIMIAHGTIAEIRSRFHRDEHAVHRIAYRPRSARVPIPQPDFDRGLIEVEEQSRSEDRIELRAYARVDSEGLSAVLDSILSSGGVILECHTEQVAFDDVFCSIIRQQHAELAVAGAGA